jgi:hypothetical protein
MTCSRSEILFLQMLMYFRITTATMILKRSEYHKCQITGLCKLHHLLNRKADMANPAIKNAMARELKGSCGFSMYLDKRLFLLSFLFNRMLS